MVSTKSYMAVLLTLGLASQALAQLPQVRVENRSDLPYSGWMQASVPFAPGAAVDRNALLGLSAGSQAADWLPFKWHLRNGQKHSVALALMKTRVALAPGEAQELQLQRTGAPPENFRFGQETLALGATGRMHYHLWVGLKLRGEETCWSSGLVGDSKVLQTSNSFFTMRLRNHPSCSSGALRQASLTYYLTMESNEDHGSFIVALGNDTLEEQPQQLDIESLELYAVPPFRFELHEPEAFGIPPSEQYYGMTRWTLLKDVKLDDGQSWAVRGRWGVINDLGTAKGEHFLAAAENPAGGVHGIADFASFKTGEAAGALGYLPQPRFSEPANGRTALEPLCQQAIVAGPFDHLGHINRVPPSAGAQPDFMAASPLFFQQAVHSGSPCAYRQPMLAVYREALRPSYYWLTGASGKEDRATVSDFPDLFFWNGRLHYDWSWNSPKGPQYQVWQTRAGYSLNTAGGFAAMDNQHYGHNSVRGVYELTADPFLGDLLQYQMTLIYWGYYTGNAGSRLGWYWRTEAERCGRMVKEALALLDYFPGDPVWQPLVDRTVTKNREVFLAKVNSYLSRFNVPAIAHFTDPRVSLYNNCIAGQYPGVSSCEVAVGWQTGFHMEAQAQFLQKGFDVVTAAAVADAYLNDVALFFDATSGQPVTYFLMRAPTIQSFGGIGTSWWTGWAELARLRPQHPSLPILTGTVMPYLDAALEGASVKNTYWKSQDAWRTFD